jgi:hypothetical protein
VVLEKKEKKKEERVVVCEYKDRVTRPFLNYFLKSSGR